MENLVAILVPIACGCVLPIMVVWLAIRKKMNETNQRTQIVLAAIADEATVGMLHDATWSRIYHCWIMS